MSSQGSPADDGKSRRDTIARYMKGPLPSRVTDPDDWRNPDEDSENVFSLFGELAMDDIAGTSYREISLDAKEADSYMSLLGELSFLNTRTFQKTLGRVEDVFKDENAPRNIVFTLASWLFRKIYTYYKVKAKERPRFIGYLTPRIDKEINVVVKGTYLHYNDSEMVKALSEHFFFNRFPKDFFILQMMNDVELIQSAKLSDGMKDHFVTWIRKAGTYEQQCNLLDVLLKYYKKDPEVMEIRRTMEFGETKGPRNLYTNDQNAHDEDITDESLLALDKLITWYKANPFIDQDDVRIGSSDEFDKMMNVVKDVANVDAVITRGKIDTTVFSTEKHRVTIMDTIIALARFIDVSPSKPFLLERLAEEFTDMNGLCPSGYITRMINVLRGVYEEYSIKIPFAKQLQAILTHKLSLAMKTATDKEIEGSIDPVFRKDYLGMVERVVNAAIPVVWESHGKDDVDANIVEVVKTTIGQDCSYQNGRITFL